MPINKPPVTTEYSECGRKRAFPTPSRRTWKAVSALTLSTSFVATIAFQQTAPISHHHSPLSSVRSPTALCVLADPTNIVKIESEQSVRDRAALEELYLLSSLAKKATRKKSNVKVETKRKRNGSPSLAERVTEINSESLARKTNTNTIEYSEDSKIQAFPATESIEGMTTGTINEQFELGGEKKNSLETDIPQGIPSLHTSHKAKPTEKVRFRGLTTVPNRRNLKQKKTPVEPLSERIGIGQDEYIRNLLRKKEESLSFDSTGGRHNAPEVEGYVMQHSYDAAKIESKSPKKNSQSLNFVHNSLSSTMPGFREGKNTILKQKISQAIKVAQQNPQIEFVDTDTSKKKRVAENGQAMYIASNSVPDSLVQFANEIHDVDRITPEEEIILGERTQEALRLQHIHDDLVTKLQREPTDDEWCAATGKFNMEAIAQIIEDGLEAKNRLVTSNLRMVQGVVNVYIRNGLQGHYNAGDLMQEGIIALIRAAEKFDPSRGFRFSTYAMYWIRSAIKRDQCNQSRIIQVPQRLHETKKRISVNKKELTETLNRSPTATELSKACRMTVPQIERCEAAVSQKIYSLDQNLVNRNNPSTGENHRDTLYSIIASKADQGEVNEFDLKNLKEDLLRAMNAHLTEEEATILILKFGLDDKYASSKKIGRSIAEVGDMVGLKPDKVRRIIKRSLKQLETLISDDFQLYNREYCL